MEEIETLLSKEGSNVKEQRAMGVSSITIQDAFHCIAVAH